MTATARRTRGPGPATCPPSLAAAWRGDAAVLRHHGAVAQAEVLEACAQALEQWLAAREAEPLTLAQASAISGYSVSQLRRLISLHVITNISPNGSVLVRRGDLPKKPGPVRGPEIAREMLGLQR